MRVLQVVIACTALLGFGCGGDDAPTPVDSGVDTGVEVDAGTDAGPIPDAGRTDSGTPTDGGTDAGSLPNRPTGAAITAGGGSTSSASYNLRVSFGAPQPMGDVSGPTKMISAGPRPGR